jgi:hypothetical protein
LQIDSEFLQNLETYHRASKGEKYVWSEECEEAFRTLKKLLTTSPILAQPEITKSLDLYRDASGIGLGCVFMQEGHVTAYSS